MNTPPMPPETVLSWLRRRLPISARMRPALLARAKAAAHDATLQPSCRVMSVYEAASGLAICHVEYVARESGTHLIVAPLSQVSFGRSNPLTRLLAPLCDSSRGAPDHVASRDHERSTKQGGQNDPR